MSLQDLGDAFAIIDAYTGTKRFMGPRPVELVEKAERVLGIPLPPTYRKFVSELGAGSVGGLEFYGITQDDFESASVPNGIWLTLNDRRELGLPTHLIIVYSDGMGGLCALDSTGANAQGEYPVVRWTGLYSPEAERIAPDFGAFLKHTLEELLE